MHSFKITSLQTMLGVKGFDSKKTSILELIVEKALKLPTDFPENNNILFLGDQLSNIGIGASISHAELKEKLDETLTINIKLIEDEISYTDKQLKLENLDIKIYNLMGFKTFINNNMINTYEICKKSLIHFKDKFEKDINKSINNLSKLIIKIKNQAKEFGFNIVDNFKIEHKDDMHTDA